MKSTDLRAAKTFLTAALPEEGCAVLVALSGGLDSMCLLHLLTTWGKKRGLRVAAAHLNHGLRGPAADRDQAFVEEICAQWGVEIECGKEDVAAFARQEKLTEEEAARIKRYDFFGAGPAKQVL